MPARREDGTAYVPKPKKKRKASSRGGHPSRGGTSVGGGTKGKKPTRYKSPTPTPPKPTVAPISDVRGRGDKAPRGSGHTTRGERVRRNQAERRSALRQLKRAERARLRSITDPRDVGDAPGYEGIPSPAAIRAETREQRRIARDLDRLKSDTAPRHLRTGSAERLADKGVVSSLSEKRARKNLSGSKEVRREVIRAHESGKIKTKADRERAAAKLKTAGITGIDLGDVAKAPLLVGRATLEDPLGVAEGNLRTVRDMALGVPGAVAKIVKDPIGGTKDTVSDYVKDVGRRYGPLVKGKDDKFVRRIKKEGFVAEGLDATALGVPVGRGAGLVLKTTKGGRRFMEAERPAKRVSGGAPRPQSLSRNAITVGGQRTADKARRVVQKRRVRRAQRNETTVDALVAQAASEGSVAPIRLRRARRKQQRDVARSKSRAVQGMKAEQVREVHKGAARDIAKLSRRERLGLKYATQLGIRSPEQARNVLRRRLEQIKADGKRPPVVLRKTNDEFRAIEAILKDPDSVFTPRLAQVVEATVARQTRTASDDPTLAPAQVEMRKWQPVAQHYRMERSEAETPEAFIARVQARASEDGITDPAYFPSQKRPSQRFSDYAVGGTRAARGDKAYTGALFRAGQEDVTPQPLLDAMARNVKRKYNWGHVAETFDNNAFGWSRGEKTLAQLKDELDERGIDPNSVGFWNPGKFSDNRTLHERADDDLDTGVGEEPSVAGIDRAVDESALDGLEGVARAGVENSKGWVVVPKGVYDEIYADTRSSGALGRTADILKGKQSRLLLGSLNLPWIQFQVAANALQTIAATGIKAPAHLVKSQIWWKNLDADQKRAVEPWVGIGPFQMDVQQTRLGAAANNRVVNAYRAFKQTPMARRVGKLNPLDALFRVDNAQNNAFRRAVLYSQVKKDAYRRMGQNSGKAMEVQARITGIYNLGPKQQMDAVLKDRRAIERHAQYVNDWLGDYATYTAKERRWLARNVMFYGFLRFSLTLAFHTMPRKHPVMTQIIGTLGNIQTEEVRTLLGGDELPFAFGKLYFSDADGKLNEVDLARMNPVTNTLVETLVPGDDEIAFLPRRLLNLLPPLYITALDLAYGKSAFSGKPLKVKGETAFDANNRQDPMAMEEMGRIAAERGLRLLYPYRLAETLEYEGEPMGDDTLLWDRRPTEYKDEEILAGIEDTKKYNRENVSLLNETIPFVPRKTRDPAIAERIRERNAGTSDKPKNYAEEAREFLKKQRDSGGYAEEARKWLQENR